MNPSGKNNLKWRYIGFIAILFLMFVYLTSGLVNLQLRHTNILSPFHQKKKLQQAKVLLAQALFQLLP